MEFDEMARNDRSALLQQRDFYRNQDQEMGQTSESDSNYEAYDNPTVQNEQIEREETPHRTNKTPLSPPPPYDHALNHQNRLYSRDEHEPSTSAATDCPQHSAQLSDSDSEPQYVEECSCSRMMTAGESRMFAAWQHNTGQTGSEIEISNKSSKQFFKLMAGDGTCKMSSECRCDECQSDYFHYEMDNNEHQKTDGGLGAGTPMFINEVMHGAACNIL